MLPPAYVDFRDSAKRLTNIDDLIKKTAKVKVCCLKLSGDLTGQAEN